MYGTCAVATVICVALCVAVERMRMTLALPVTYCCLRYCCSAATNVGDEGGFAPNIQDNREGMVSMPVLFMTCGLTS